MNVPTQDTCKSFRFTPRRTESFADSRVQPKEAPFSRNRVFSFSQSKRIHIQRKQNQNDLNSTKDSVNCTQTTKANSSAISKKTSRPLTAQNNQKTRKSEGDKFKFTLNIPEEQKQTIFGPVVKKIYTPVNIRTPFNLINSECQSTERNRIGMNKYCIGKDIGKGAYAVVKSITNKQTNEKFALKIYDKLKFTESSRLRNAFREIEILSSLSHRNIIKLHEHHDSAESLYLILDLIQGPSLSDHSKRYFERRLPEKEACSIFYQLMQAVSYCHSQSVSHRDIKYDNILLDETSTVKLIDFGFSTRTQSPSKVFCGTPSYMAPEIIQKVEYFGPPVDIWACGVVLFGLLCGYFPFKSQNDKDCYRKIIAGLVYIPNFVSKGPRELLEKMLRTNPDARITAQEVLKSQWFLDMQVLDRKGEQIGKEISLDLAFEQLVRII
jgi:tRNA A-37 threonylcarbamoyl transferase component Bud32